MRTLLEKAACSSILAVGFEMEFKTVLLRYQQSREKVLIPKQKEGTDIQFLELSFRMLFKFDNQVNLQILFQRFDPAFDDFFDLDERDEIRDLEKLKVVVTPVLTTPPAVSYFPRLLFANENSYIIL